MSQPAPNHVGSTLGGLAAIVLWSTTIALARSLSEQLGSLQAGAATYLAASALAVAQGCRTGTMRRCHCTWPGRYLWICGLLFVAYTVLLFLAVGRAADRIQAVEVGLLNYLWPALTLVLSMPLNGTRARWTLAPATLLALAGVGLVMTQGTGFTWRGFSRNVLSGPLPYVLASLAALTWALYSNLARRWAGGAGSGAVPLFLASSGLVLLVLSGLDPVAARWSWRACLEVLALGGMTALAYGLWERAMRRGHLTWVTVSSYATPLLSTLFSCAYLAVQPAASLWIGCLLLVTGSLLSAWSVRSTEASSR